jgi:hypothetical protein
MLDPLRDRLKKHSSPSKTSKVKDPFGGCALRSPVEPSLWIRFYDNTSLFASFFFRRKVGPQFLLVTG